jgi:hypothetical protein
MSYSLLLQWRLAYEEASKENKVSLLLGELDFLECPNGTIILTIPFGHILLQSTQRHHP